MEARKEGSEGGKKRERGGNMKVRRRKGEDDKRHGSKG